MAKVNKAKQAAMIRACKMAGFEVARRDSSQPEHSMVLVDDMSNKYHVVKGVIIKQVHTNAIKNAAIKAAIYSGKAATVKGLRIGRMKSRRTKNLRANRKAIG